MGLTTKGAIGAKTALSLEDTPAKVQEIADAARRINPDVIVLCHGGSLSEPDDVAYVLERTKGVDGFYGASSMERLPTEVAIAEQIRRFGNLKLSGL